LSLEPDVSVFRPDRPGIRKMLGDLEADIMEIIWGQSGAVGTTVRDVFEVLYERRRIAYTTVMNTMSRLARKRLLRVEKREHAYVYYPNFTQEEFVSRFAARILEDLLVSFGGPREGGAGPTMDAATADRARELLEDITRRRSVEEAD